MKKIRSISSLLLALLLVLSLSFSALAVDETGSITVQNALAKQSYYVYRIFDLESYDKDNNAYSYLLNDAWDDFARLNTIEGVYLTLETNSDNKTYVKWIDGADSAAFAKLALAYAQENNVEIVDGKSPTEAGDIVFEDLPLGYYLIDSSVGALCALTTNDPDAVVKEKNELTTVEKLVKEDSTGDYGKENSAQVGDTVSFKSEITLGEGIENLVLHDVMDSYLELKVNSFEITIQDQTVDAANYQVSTGGVDAEQVYHSLADKCTFEISFNDAYTATLKKGTVLCVKYDAILGYNAPERKTFDNETWVSFGDDLTSTHSETQTHTYSFDLLKTDDEGNIIQTATFRLYDAQNGGSVIPVIAVKEDSNTGIYHYRVATAEDGNVGEGALIKAGYASVFGLDKDVYYLEEIDQPSGFNRLSERVKVDMTNGDISGELNDIFAANNGAAVGANVSEAGGVQVINKSGTVLPSTGGAGTVMFYAIGTILALGTVVVLITRMRMKVENN